MDRRTDFVSSRPIHPGFRGARGASPLHSIPNGPQHLQFFRRPSVSEASYTLPTPVRGPVSPTVAPHPSATSPTSSTYSSTSPVVPPFVQQPRSVLERRGSEVLQGDENNAPVGGGLRSPTKMASSMEQPPPSPAVVSSRAKSPSPLLATSAKLVSTQNPTSPNAISSSSHASAYLHPSPQQNVYTFPFPYPPQHSKSSSLPLPPNHHYSAQLQSTNGGFVSAPSDEKKASSDPSMKTSDQGLGFVGLTPMNDRSDISSSFVPHPALPAATDAQPTGLGITTPSSRRPSFGESSAALTPPATRPRKGSVSEVGSKGGKNAARQLFNQPPAATPQRQRTTVASFTPPSKTPPPRPAPPPPLHVSGVPGRPRVERGSSAPIAPKQMLPSPPNSQSRPASSASAVPSTVHLKVDKTGGISNVPNKIITTKKSEGILRGLFSKKSSDKSASSQTSTTASASPPTASDYGRSTAIPASAYPSPPLATSSTTAPKLIKSRPQRSSPAAVDSLNSYQGTESSPKKAHFLPMTSSSPPPAHQQLTQERAAEATKTPPMRKRKSAIGAGSDEGSGENVGQDSPLAHLSKGQAASLGGDKAQLSSLPSFKPLELNELGGDLDLRASRLFPMSSYSLFNSLTTPSNPLPPVPSLPATVVTPEFKPFSWEIDESDSEAEKGLSDCRFSTASSTTAEQVKRSSSDWALGIGSAFDKMVESSEDEDDDRSPSWLRKSVPPPPQKEPSSEQLDQVATGDTGILSPPATPMASKRLSTFGTPAPAAFALVKQHALPLSPESPHQLYGETESPSSGQQVFQVIDEEDEDGDTEPGFDDNEIRFSMIDFSGSFSTIANLAVEPQQPPSPATTEPLRIKPKHRGISSSSSISSSTSSGSSLSSTRSSISMEHGQSGSSATTFATATKVIVPPLLPVIPVVQKKQKKELIVRKGALPSLPMEGVKHTDLVSEMNRCLHAIQTSPTKAALIRGVLLPILYADEKRGYNVYDFEDNKAMRRASFDWLSVLITNGLWLEQSANERGATLEAIAALVESPAMSVQALDADPEDAMLFRQVVRTILTFVMEKLSSKGIFQNTLSFTGRMLAFAFFRVEGIAQQLLVGLPVHRMALQRLEAQVNVSCEEQTESVKFEISWPHHLKDFVFENGAVEYLKSLQVEPHVYENQEDDFAFSFQPGNWLRRFQSDDSELFFSFFRAYHRQLALFLPTPEMSASPATVFSAPGYAHLVTVFATKCLSYVQGKVISVTTTASLSSFSSTETAGFASSGGKPPILESANRRLTETFSYLLNSPVLIDINQGVEIEGSKAWGRMTDIMLRSVITRVNLYDPRGVFCMFDLLDGVSTSPPDPFRDLTLPPAPSPVFNTPFIINVLSTILKEADHALTLCKVISYIFTHYETLCARSADREALLDGLLLTQEVFERLFLFWSQSVRSYIVRLIVFRLSHLPQPADSNNKPNASALEVATVRLLNDRLEAIRHRHAALEPASPKMEPLVISSPIPGMTRSRSTIAMTAGSTSSSSDNTPEGNAASPALPASVAAVRGLGMSPDLRRDDTEVIGAKAIGRATSWFKKSFGQNKKRVKNSEPLASIREAVVCDDGYSSDSDDEDNTTNSSSINSSGSSILLKVPPTGLLPGVEINMPDSPFPARTDFDCSPSPTNSFISSDRDESSPELSSSYKMPNGLSLPPPQPAQSPTGVPTAFFSFEFANSPRSDAFDAPVAPTSPQPPTSLKFPASPVVGPSPTMSRSFSKRSSLLTPLAISIIDGTPDDDESTDKTITAPASKASEGYDKKLHPYAIRAFAELEDTIMEYGEWYGENGQGTIDGQPPRLTVAWAFHDDD